MASYPDGLDFRQRLLRNASIKATDKPCERLRKTNGAFFPPSHHGSGCKTAHNAHENAVHPTLCPGGHEAGHASGRCDERMGDGEDAAAQEALQLKRRNLELPVVGWERQRLAQSLRAEAECNMYEFAGEHDLAKLINCDTHALAEVEIE
jgi:hypothetical protein